MVLVDWYPGLVSGLTVFFSVSVYIFDLNSSFIYSEAVIVRIDEVCLGV